MTNVGNKIRKIRELKNITPKDMAERLDMSLQGYSKIERDEVAINIDRLVEIAGIFEMKPEDVLTFDEKIIFSNNTLSENATGVNLGTIHNGLPEKVIQLYEDKIKLLEEKIKWLEERLKG